MIRIARILAISAILAVLTPAIVTRGADNAASPPANALQTKVKKLIADLDADARAVRQQVERELLNLGPDVLPLLPPPELLPSAAVQGAVKQIRKVLEVRK